MKKFFTLLAALTALTVTNPVWGGDYTIATDPAPASPVLSYVIPLVAQTSIASSVTQQVFLASELSDLGATAGDITGIKFYYGGKSNNTAVPIVTRSLKIYLQETTADSLIMYEIAGTYTTQYRFKFVGAGTLVHDGSITTEAISAGEIKTLSISFNQGSFSWDGTKNLILTVFDVTNTAYSSIEANLRFELKTTSHARYAHQYWMASGDKKASDYLSTLAGLESDSYTSGSGTTKDKQVRGHRYVPKTTFTIVTPVPAPTGLSTSSITENSATLSWTAATGADSYELRYGTTSGSLGAASNIGDVTSYDLSGLEEGTTYYWQVRTKIGSEYSAWTDEANFTTTAESHEHNGVSFSKWSSGSSLPTSGSYYLNSDVAFSLMDENVTLTGDLKLCLNGKTANLAGSGIIVPDGKTLTIYDNEGSGKITSFFPGSNGISPSGLITIESGGTLVLSEGEIENSYVTDEDGHSIAICNSGTLKLSGDPAITSGEADIFLGTSKVITIESGKPLTGSSPYSVYKVTTGAITSGWSNMSGAKPGDYFTAANSAQGVCLKDGEAQLVKLLSLDGANAISDNLSSNSNQIVNFRLANRTLTSASFNTICLPFSLTDDELEEVFGSGYDLEAFVGSSYDGEVLDLAFNKVSALSAGQPYLIQPSADAVNPTFVGVRIDEDALTPIDQTSDTYVSFHGVYTPTELTGGNKNLLFLGTGNTLYWPETTGNIKGFRAYFEVKAGAARAAVRARIVKASETATGVENTTLQDDKPRKMIRDGQLLIERDGAVYDVMGRKID